MKRDMELVRLILQTVEDHDHGFAPREIVLDGYDQEAIGYHSYLIIDAGLAEGTKVTNRASKTPCWRIRNLCSKGHDFLDASREPKRWNKAKEALGNATIGAYLGLLEKLAVHYACKISGIDK